MVDNTRQRAVGGFIAVVGILGLFIAPAVVPSGAVVPAIGISTGLLFVGGLTEWYGRARPRLRPRWLRAMFFGRESVT